MINIIDGITFDDVLLIPKHSKIHSRKGIDLSVTLSKGIVLKNPIIPANMKTVTGIEAATEIYKLGGMAILHRFMPIDEQLKISKSWGHLLYEKEEDNHLNYIGFSIGIKESDYHIVDQFAANGVKILCIDIAHGDSSHCVSMTKYISEKYPSIFLIAGNVATSQGARALWKAGADAVKVGIGPGSLCTTRIETGNGFPQLTALDKINDMKYGFEKELSKKLFIIADGGIKNSGDIVKSLCFADMVMAGNLFAGAEETPGDILDIDGNKYKSYVGSSTHKTNHVEGVVALVPVKGKIKDIVSKLLEGVKSGCSYQGVNNLSDLKKDPQFVRITNAGLKESHAHDVHIVK